VITRGSAAIKEISRKAGFDLVGITSAEPLPEARERMHKAWTAGRLEALPWMTAERIQRAPDPRSLLPEAQSVLCLAVGYLTSEAEEPEPEGVPTGRVARYARGIDYHRTVQQRLRVVLRQTEALVGRSIAARLGVDSIPLAEKPLASRAGLGWIGKHTMLVTPSLGSWLVLGEIVWDLELEPDPPAAGGCGDCDRCLQACPTGALVAPYHLDVARCLSYITKSRPDIQIPGGAPVGLGGWLYGCDACQDACPYNKGATVPDRPEWRGLVPGRLPLESLLSMTEAEWEERYAGSGLRRGALARLQANAREILEARG
jgi:epoxyqueuosine reductase